MIGDKKTPKTINKFCKKIEKKYKTKIFYLSISDQDKFFKKFSKLYKMFPYNDAVRKLLGSIYAWVNYKKLKRVIFIDDDNYLDHTKSFLKGHEDTGFIKNVSP